MLSKVYSLAFLALCLCLPAKAFATGVYFLRTNYSVGTQPAGICLANLRGRIDGSQVFRDVATANSAADTVSIRLCLDDGTFGHRDDYPVGSNPVAVLFSDLDGDNWGDLATANFGTNTISVLHNLGVGANFATQVEFVVGSTANPGPKGITFADANHDSRIDIIVANYTESTVSVLTNEGGMEFSGLTNFPVGAGPSFIFRRDLNKDGPMEILTANTIDGSVSILFGLTNGFYAAATNITLYPGGDPQPVCIAAVDLNGDTCPDIITANYNSNSISVLIGNNNGGLWEVQTRLTLEAGLHPKSLCVRDFNADGIPDIAVANEGDDNVRVFFGTGAGFFALQGDFAVGDSPSGLAGSNFNEDQSTDLAVANAGDDTISILLFSGPLAYDLSRTVSEDTPTNSITLQGSLLSGIPLLFEVVVAPTNGMLSGSGRTVFYTPDTNYFGLDSFTFQTVDTNSSLTSAVATVTINVLPVNDRPSFTIATNVITVLEDAARTNLIDFATNMVAGPANEASQTFSFVVTTTNAALFAARPAISSTGLLSFKPRRNAVGSTTVQARVRDSGGNLRGGVNLGLPEDITIVIEPHPLKAHRGIYAGLFQDTNGVVEHADSGFFTLTMNAYGRFSGYLRGDGGKHRFTGQFDLSGHALVNVSRPLDTLVMDLQLDLTNGTDQVAGLITNSAGIYSALIGDRGVYRASTNPCPLAGAYTLVIPGNSNPTNGAGGDSYATLNITSAGLIRASGKLSDGTAFTQSVRVSKYGNWPFYISLLANRGSVLSWLTFTNLPANTIEGNVSWIKPTNTSNFYPLGFTNLTAAVGSAYVLPGEPVHIINSTNNLITVSGGDVPGSFNYNSTLTDLNIVRVGSVTFLTVASYSNGRMSGSFTHPLLGVNKALNAVPLQLQNEIRGFFLGSNLSGQFLLESDD